MKDEYTQQNLSRVRLLGKLFAFIYPIAITIGLDYFPQWDDSVDRLLYPMGRLLPLLVHFIICFFPVAALFFWLHSKFQLKVQVIAFLIYVLFMTPITMFVQFSFGCIARAICIR
jgi:hypothetical protein